MISCTEFIPAYSELFSFLDENYGGHEEVERFWTYLFQPTGKGIPLVNMVKKDGLRGAWNYSNKALSEEAADCTRYFNEKAGWLYNEMHYCPSKGRLLQLEKELGLKPYYDYCGHCDYYRSHMDAAGLGYTRFHLHVDKASCSQVTYDPKLFKGILVPDENTEILEIRSADNEYFHRDFHSSLNRGIEYVASTHGEQALTDYLVRFTESVYKPVIAAMAEDPLGAIEAKIRQTYEAEKAPDVLTVVNDGSTLSVTVAHCPAVKHLHQIGREVSRWFRYTTEVVMKALAAHGGLAFEMLSYDEQTGAAAYRFARR